jgi:hypothetical protein
MRPTPWPTLWPDPEAEEQEAAAPSKPHPDELEPLDLLILRENCLDILCCLEPDEMVIAGLRLEGLSDVQIGQILGIDRTTVSRYLSRAQERIMRELPYTAGLLAGRQPERGNLPPIPGLLEQGWICDWSDPDAWPEDAIPGADARQGG